MARGYGASGNWRKSMSLRWPFRSMIVVFAACTVVAIAAWLVNRPIFDQSLIDDLQALKTARAPALERNAYLVALGFLAADRMDPESAGKAIVAALNARYETGQPIALSSEERDSLLGTNGGPGTWQSRLKTLKCVARVELDCADRLIAEVASVDLSEPRLDVLSGRLEILLHQERLDEGQRRDIHTPIAAYGAIRDIARVSLARSFRKDSDAAFIARALDHLRFWKLVLRNGQALASKMIAVAAIQDTLDFLSALMRERALTPADAGVIEHSVTPMTPQELDISDAFLTEARNQVLSDDLPLAEGASRIDRLMILRNETLNDYFVSVIQPILLRAKLSPAEFHRAGGNRPLNLYARHDAPLLFNRGGYRLVHHMEWDPEQFLARTQDQNGRLVLVALQAELEKDLGLNREVIVNSSSHRNPYTGEPMRLDAKSGVIGFQCMHTAYHPPAQPDQCAIRIDL